MIRPGCSSAPTKPLETWRRQPALTLVLRVRVAPFVAVSLVSVMALVTGCAPAVPVAAPSPQAEKAAEAKPVAVRAAAMPAFVATSSARAAFARACPALLRRTDQSGLTSPEDWKPACADPEQDPARFFARHFAPVQIGSGKGFSTGYFEPEIAGSRAPRPGSAPVYARPVDLVDVNLGSFADDLKGRTLRGRWTGKALVPYFSRREIDEGALSGRGLELAYADDPVELFFLQIQGSGRLRLPDGEQLRLSYAAQNGHAYVAIGRLLRQRGALEKAGMEEIIGWIRANPEAGRALMQENPSYVFFQLGDPRLDGPIGSLGVPLLAEANAAADPATLPLGAPLVASLAVAGTQRTMLLIASDTGGAIRGPNRIDIFWGGGAKARAIASGLAAPADIMLLLPKSAADRLPQ